MKLKKIKANFFLFWNNLFRLPAVALAIVCLIMLHVAFYVTTEVQRYILPVKAQTILERKLGRKEYAEAIHEGLHEVGREVALIAWILLCIKLAVKLW